jgi:hypothetical protein
MCRGPLCFRGFLSSGWRQEKEGRTEDFDTIVQRVLDTLIATRFEEFVDDEITPDTYDLEELMYDLSDVQTTMNALYSMHEFHPDEIEEFVFCDYMYIAMKRRFTDWCDDPPKPFFTRYPEIV